jgi:hypothetical protein
MELCEWEWRSCSKSITFPEPELLTYDFVEHYCDAELKNSLGIILACSGVDGDVQGSVARVDYPTLENGVTANDPGLLARPENAHLGWTEGAFP